MQITELSKSILEFTEKSHEVNKLIQSRIENQQDTSSLKSTPMFSDNSNMSQVIVEQSVREVNEMIFNYEKKKDTSRQSQLMLDLQLQDETTILDQDMKGQPKTPKKSASVSKKKATESKGMNPMPECPKNTSLTSSKNKCPSYEQRSRVMQDQNLQSLEAQLETFKYKRSKFSKQQLKHIFDNYSIEDIRFQKKMFETLKDDPLFKNIKEFK